MVGSPNYFQSWLLTPNNLTYNINGHRVVSNNPIEFDIFNLEVLRNANFLQLPDGTKNLGADDLCMAMHQIIGPQRRFISNRDFAALFYDISYKNPRTNSGDNFELGVMENRTAAILQRQPEGNLGYLPLQILREPNGSEVVDTALKRLLG